MLLCWKEKAQERLWVQERGLHPPSSPQPVCALLEAGKDPDTFQNIMNQIGEHHSKDEQTWNGGSCIFHPHTVCFMWPLGDSQPAV